MSLNFALSSFITFFIIVDPIVNVPLFRAFLSDLDQKTRQKMVKKAVIVAAVVLVIFTLAGNTIFHFLGIEMYSFRIAGGIILLIIAIEMLLGRRPGTKTSAAEEEESMQSEDLVVTPLAVPLLTGPGAITTGIVLFDTASGITDQVLLFAVIGLVYLLSYFILSRSEKVFDSLGHTGTMVIVRIMGLLVAAIAIQFMITGIEEAVVDFMVVLV
ncbi:MAG TPA: NAAT family transporter [Methanosarcinaceae archaeon]|nr:NAAT family transporter [Methanosarcinaceae archaeon]